MFKPYQTGEMMWNGIFVHLCFFPCHLQVKGFFKELGRPKDRCIRPRAPWMITGVPREIRQENFPHNHVNPQTKEINRLGRARQSGSQCDAKGSQCEFSYVVLPRLINDEFFKMIQDQMWQFVEICHMTFLSNYSVLSETVPRICFHTSLASCFQDLAALPWK